MAAGYKKNIFSSFPLTFISLEQSILLSGCLIHGSPKMTLFCCELQSLITIVIECTLLALVRCLFPLAQICTVYQADVCCVCQQVEKINNKQTQAWTGGSITLLPGLEPSALSLYTFFMLPCTLEFIIQRLLNVAIAEMNFCNSLPFCADSDMIVSHILTQIKLKTMHGSSLMF